MKEPLIGFFGLKNAGKDEAALALLDGEEWADGQIFKFATPLKEMGAALLKVDVEMLNGDTEQSRSFRELPNEFLNALTGGAIKTPRYLLQWLGTDAFRSLHKDIWVNHLELRLNNHEGPAFVTDCRFENEMKMIKDLGGVCIKIERPGLESKDSHVSEAMPFEDKDFDAIIKNDGELFEFHSKVQKLVNNMYHEGWLKRT